MKILSTTGVTEDRFGILEAIKMHAEAGFEALDFSLCGAGGKWAYTDGWEETASQVKRLADELGLAFLQTHGPFPPYPAITTPEGREAFTAKAKRAIEVASYLGAPCMVFHPVRLPYGTHEDQLGHNIELYSPLLPLAREKGVRIALENMHAMRLDENGNKVKHVCITPEEHRAFVEAFNDEFVVACLDIGHTVVAGSTPHDFVRGLGDKLYCLHVHDNDGIMDMHTLPFSGKLDFAEFTRALAEIGYRGNITLEATNYESKLPKEIYTDGLKIMAKSAGAIRDAVLAAGKADKQ